MPFAIRDGSRPLLVLGPSLGTSVGALWMDAVPGLADAADLLGWDLPGHGTSGPTSPAELEGLTIADLADAVLDGVDRVQAARGDSGAAFWFAGVSLAGAVGQQLLVEHPDRLLGAALICTASRFEPRQPWLDRADLVARAGTPTQVTGSAERWFAPGFIEHHPEVATRLLAGLQTADRFSYAALCRALADFDLTGRLGRIAAPVVAIAGAEDVVIPPERMERMVAEIPNARLEVLDGVAHLAPAERPDLVARIVGGMVTGRVPS